MELTKKLFSFKGRINRLPYWMVYIGLTVAVIIIIFALSTVLPAKTVEGQVAAQFTPVQLAASICLSVVNIIYLWNVLAISVKRLHDRDQSGWWLLVGLIPLLGQLWYFIVVMCLPGTAGENRFGSDPREASG